MSDEERIKAVKEQMRRNRLEGKSYRVLFLDFDGVVNVPYEYGTPEYNAAMEEGVYDFFRPEIVVRLNRLIHDYDLHVVISSSWRYSGIEFCQNSLKNAGFDEDVVIQGTTALSEGFPPRWSEILEYTEAHPEISEILILDDIPMKKLSEFAVQTNFEDGYTDQSDHMARYILDHQIHSLKAEDQMHKIAAAAGIVILLIFIVIFLLNR